MNTYKIALFTATIYFVCIKNAFAVLNNPPQNTTITTTETVNYTIAINANSQNNLNISNVGAGNTFTINVSASGDVTNSTFFRDIINITGGQSHNVFITIAAGGQMHHNTTTKEIVDDDSGAAGTLRLTNSGSTIGRFNGSLSRTACEVINNASGTMQGDMSELTTLTNAGTITFGGTGVTSTNLVNNTGALNTGISLNTNGIVNNNGAGTITGNISGSGTSTLNIGPSVANAFATSATISVNTITVGGGSSFTVNSGGNITSFASWTGAGSVTNNGTISINTVNALATTSTVNNTNTINVNAAYTPSSSSFTNSGTLNLQATFTAPGSFTNTGTTILTGSGNISGAYSGGAGSVLNVRNAYVPSGAITGIRTISLDQASASLTTSGANTISGGDTLSLIANTQATLGAAFSCSGTVSNSGTLSIANTFTTGTVTNNSGGTIELNTNAQNASVINNSAGGAINILGNNVTTSAAINNSGTVNLSGTISGAGVLTNSGSMFMTAGASNALSITNNLNFTISGASTNTGAISNSAAGTIGISTTLSGAGTITNAGTLNLLAGANVANAITNNLNMVVSASATAGTVNNNSALDVSAAFTVTTLNNNNNGNIYIYSTPVSISSTINGAGTNSVFVGRNSAGTTFANTAFTTSANISDVTNINVVAGTFSTSHTLSGGGTITNDAIMNFTASTSNAMNVTNNLTFNITGATTNTGVLSNAAAGIMNVSSSLTGAGTIVNAGTLNLLTGANVANSITNNATMNTSGTVTLTANLANLGALTIGGDINMAGQTITSSGGSSSVTISGTRALTATSYDNQDNHYTTITSDVVFDQLNVTGDVNLNGSTLHVSGDSTLSGSWNVITCTGTLTGPSNTDLPASSDSLFTAWIAEVQGNNLVVSSTSTPFVDEAEGVVNIEIAEVLDGISNNITNSDQQILINAFSQYTNSADYNAGLQSMRPNANANTPFIATQAAIFNKVEHRIASLQGEATYGITAGDLNSCTGLWLGGFGSFAKQKPYEENVGYKSKIYGGILGIDSRSFDNSIWGLGFGYSKTIVDEYLAPDFNTNVEGYHLLTYGTNALSDITFFEWLATGAYSRNNGSRRIDINGTIMSTTSNYSAYQAAARVNYVLNVALAEEVTFSPLTMFQYALVYQPNYDEAYSPAALHINSSNYQNVLTVGGGFRLSFPCKQWFLVGTREIRVMGTYDIVSSDNNIVSNFLVGSGTFAITNPAAARLALKTGIDLNFEIVNNLFLQFSYDYEVRARYWIQSAAAKLKFVF